MNSVVKVSQSDVHGHPTVEGAVLAAGLIQQNRGGADEATLHFPGRVTLLLLTVGPMLFALSACRYSPFNDGPTRSDGVAVSLARLRCSSEPAWTPPGHGPVQLDLWMRLAIRNDTAQTVTVNPQGLRLLAENLVVDRHGIVGQVQSLAPAQTDTLDVLIRQRGDLRCGARMSLSLEKFIQIGARSVPLEPISFVANATST